VTSDLITKTLQIGLNVPAKFNHFRRASPAPSTDIDAIVSKIAYGELPSTTRMVEFAGTEDK
jgi:hypothetical protein